MDLRQLQYFVRVAELGSFTRAAQELAVAQPALSRQVRLLEVELRQHLLARNGRGALPTEAGKLLLAHARGILHQVERAREELGRVRGALAGRVALGLPPTVAKVLAVPLVRAFRAELPAAQVSISEGLSLAMQSSLLQGRLDVALLYNAQPQPGMELTPLLTQKLVLVQRRAARARPVRPAPIGLREVAALPLVIPSQPNSLRMLLETELAALGLAPTIALEIDGVAAILELVEDGAGSAILPAHAVATAAHPEAFTTRAIVRPALQSRLALATSSQRPATLTQRAALALVGRITRELLLDR